ncbi:hypothetical protein B0H16DRAFT_1466148 [Mycena metata]|uniref:Uncharacterized protein n=1 Tax=Mycena metata TaxID=1033252 RepID=A0AAD7MZE7_9AGAR|nr:hypothetical protein B0H16DRAFT_1466148 [Mycena metata]
MLRLEEPYSQEPETAMEQINKGTGFSPWRGVAWRAAVAVLACPDVARRGFCRNIGQLLFSWAVNSTCITTEAGASTCKTNFGQRIVEKLNTVNTLSCHSLRSEASCVEVIDKDGIMTKDVALAIHGGNMKRELQNHAELRDPRAGGEHRRVSVIAIPRNGVLLGAPVKSTSDNIGILSKGGKFQSLSCSSFYLKDEDNWTFNQK